MRPRCFSFRLLSSVGASKAMAAYFSAGVRAVLHTFKDVVEALLDPSRHAHLNSLTGMVSTCCELSCLQSAVDVSWLRRMHVV